MMTGMTSHSTGMVFMLDEEVGQSTVGSYIEFSDVPSSVLRVTGENVLYRCWGAAASGRCTAR